MQDISETTSLAGTNISNIARQQHITSSSTFQAQPHPITRLSDEELNKKEDLMKMYQLRKSAQNVVIPVNDHEVKMRLRELGKPICLFGEKPEDRRDRLKAIIQKKVLQEGKVPMRESQLSQNKNLKEKTVLDNEVFYTEGTHELREARLNIAKYSIPKAAYRLEVTKKIFMEKDQVKDREDYERYLNKLKSFEFIGTQFADERTCSRGALSADNNYYGVAGGSGVCSIFTIPALKKVTELTGHKDRVNCLTFNPHALTGESNTLPKMGPNIATASSDNTVKIWSFDEDLPNQKSVTFKGHDDRVNFVEFHPMGTYLASSSHDKTWRLWDIETKKELMLQEGHITHVYPISIQKDGALLVNKFIKLGKWRPCWNWVNLGFEEWSGNNGASRAC